MKLKMKLFLPIFNIFLVCSVQVVSQDVQYELPENYDKLAYPSKFGEPVNVSIHIYIEDMIPNENRHMFFTISMYFRQFWGDYRLSGNSRNHYSSDKKHSHPMILAWEFSELIWTPDLYFPYGKKGKRHTLISPNILIRLAPDGGVFYSQRLTVLTYCEMDLKNYPFDKQTCKFPVESYAYPNRQMHVDWNESFGGPIFPPKLLRMGEYTFDRYEYYKVVTNYGIDFKYDTLIAVFHFKRNVVPFILKMYIPCMLVVMLSWISFWIDYRTTPARVSLGITSVLTIAILGNSIHTAVPSVSYMKSIDFYLILCFFFVFCALIEYAFVGVTDRRWKKLKRQETINDEQLNVSYGKTNNGFTRNEDGATIQNRRCTKRLATTEAPDVQTLEETYQLVQKVRKRGKMAQKILKDQRKNKETHYIDRWSRILFPVSFLLCNIIYFALSLSLV